jgi:hypothetical protein
MMIIQSLPGLIPRRLRRKVKSGFQDTSPLAARSFILFACEKAISSSSDKGAGGRIRAGKDTF